MEVIWDINKRPESRETVLTLGTFDGVHLGHQEIIKEVKRRTAEIGGISTLITFEPHPQLVVQKADRPQVKILTSIEEKIDILADMKLDRVIIIPFDHNFAAIEPEQFVKETLVATLNMKWIIIGHDHAFGKNRKGNYELLKRLSTEFHFGVDVVQPVMVENKIISSTQIRKLLLQGRVELAAKMLGRPYSIRGKVVQGHGRGKAIGFPTANLKPISPNKLIPKIGIYATRIKVDDEAYNSVTYIGERPTFNLSEKVIEVHIADFSDELYGREVELALLHFIRDDAKFSSTEELILQIEEDKIKSLELLNKNSD